MAIDVQEEILIASSRKTVATVMFDPRCDLLWIRNLRGVYPLTSGQYKKHAKVERVGDFMNRRYSSKLLVTKFEQDRFVEFYADEPFEMNMRYQLGEKSPDSTIAMVKITSFGEILINSPVSIIAKNLSEIVRSDLKNLKQHVENA